MSQQKQGHTGSRWREWTSAVSERNNCSKFSSPVFSHSSPALQTADNHVSHYKETAISGVSILPHTFDIAQSLDISFSCFLFLVSLICLQRRMSAILGVPLVLNNTNGRHAFIIQYCLKNVLDCGNCVRFCPKRNILFKDWFIQLCGLHCCKFPVAVSTATEMVTAGPSSEWIYTSYKHYRLNPSRGVKSF